MEMTSLNISLRKPVKEYVEARVREGNFSSPSEYMWALVREDRKRLEETKLEAMLLESLESGEPIEVTPEYWEKKCLARQ